MLRQQIEKTVFILVGKALWACGRAADMATFAFGEAKKIPDRHGGERIVGDYALHVQCPWRITRDGQVVVGSHDLYYPADYHDINEELPPEFDWDRAPSRRDKILAALFESGKKKYVVERVEVGSAGLLRVILDEGYCLDVFPNDSLDREHWRLFRPGVQEPHFVVVGSHIET